MGPGESGGKLSLARGGRRKTAGDLDSWSVLEFGSRGGGRIIVEDELRDTSRDGSGEAHVEVFLDWLRELRTWTKRENVLEGSPSGEGCASKVLRRKLDDSLVVRRRSRRSSELDESSSRLSSSATNDSTLELSFPRKLFVVTSLLKLMVSSECSRLSSSTSSSGIVGSCPIERR